MSSVLPAIEHPLIAEAEKLPQGKYLTPGVHHVDLDKVMILAESNCEGITNADSEYPILGTQALASCLGIALYNKKTKTAKVVHDIGGNLAATFEHALKEIRKNKSDGIELHLIGAYDDEDPRSNYLVEELEFLLQSVRKQPHVTLKTFDVLDRPHPTDFAIDSRNGKLIRGTEDIFAGYDSEMDYFATCAKTSENFDGIQMPRQKKRHL